jgi:tRNA/tmRNA/rRNA uracil-C5-methylase (TrmA/RlmC/RlmD family)
VSATKENPADANPAEDDAPLLELEVGAIAGGGGCVARDEEGRVVFVRHALPGERVRARVTSAAKHYRRADAVEILVASADRVTPPCPVSGPGGCGGCDFQHASLAAQRKLKAERASEQLQRVAGIAREVVVEPVRGDRGGLGWRTRIRLATDAAGQPSFRRHRSHALIPVTDCPIAHRGVLDTGALGAIWPAGIEFEIASGDEDALVDVDAPKRRDLRLPPVAAGEVINGKTVRKPAAVHATVAGTTFRVSAGVFWQVHSGAAAALSDAVTEALGAAKGDKVVDLYAGAGLFAVRLARVVGRSGSVLAVERDRRACADAAHNGNGLTQLRVEQASVNPGVIAHRLGQPTHLVLDPAREGAGTAVMAALAAHHGGLTRLVYVSCDPASFSRDARVLLDAGWTLDALRAFDIFPMTEHVEMVATLTPPG